MSRVVFAFALLLIFGVIKLPAERALALQHRQVSVSEIADLDLRERIGQLGFVAALSGFRAVVAWERTEWGRVLFLFRQVTTLQPHVPLFWDMAAWHMAWNASAAAMNDSSQPRLALRVKAQREYFALGNDFLERGIKTIRTVPNSTKRSPGFTTTSCMTTSALRNFTKRRPIYRARTVTICAFQPMSFPTARAASAKLTSDCARSMMKARKNGCRR